MSAKPHSLEEHVKMGQLIKDACNAIEEIIEYGKRHKMLLPKDLERLQKQEYQSPAIEKLRCRLDDEVFRDCPWLTNAAFGVYYRNNETITADELRQLAIATWKDARK